MRRPTRCWRLGATAVRMDDDGLLAVHRTFQYHVQPFEGANIEQSALDFTGIDPWHPFREAVPEAEALKADVQHRAQGDA